MISIRVIIISMAVFIMFGCTTQKDYISDVKYVDLNQFLDKWYVIAGRLTSFEEGAHNSVESYTWNKEENRIDVDFTMRVNSFDGKLKSIPQIAWVEDTVTNAHWKIRPFWPLKLNYIVIDVADDYSWTVVGVPSQKWVWVMAKDWKMTDETLDMILEKVAQKGYSVEKVNRVPQKW